MSESARATTELLENLTRYELHAALRVWQLVAARPMTTPQLRGSLVRMSTRGVYSLSTLWTGAETARALGLVESSGDRWRLTQLGESLTYGGGEDPAESVIAALCETLAPSRESRELIARACANLELPGWLGEVFLAKLDREASELQRREVGEAGESIVYDRAMRSRDHGGNVASVEWSSKLSDAFGYDIAVASRDGSRRFLEVKSTLRDESYFDFFLTRNEMESARRNAPDWLLVLVRVTNLSPVEGFVEGVLTSADLLAAAPSDGQDSVWELARVRCASPAAWTDELAWMRV